MTVALAGNGRLFGPAPGVAAAVTRAGADAAAEIAGGTTTVPLNTNGITVA